MHRDAHKTELDEACTSDSTGFRHLGI